VYTRAVFTRNRFAMIPARWVRSDLDSAASANERENFQTPMNFGSTEPHVMELEEARAEWRRRHPKLE
jgi:hypothetical protein